MLEPTVDQCLMWATQARQREMDLLEAYRVALEACADEVKDKMDRARDLNRFRRARSAYRLACAALGREHD